AAPEIGGPQVLDFGFPVSYTAYRTQEVVGGKGVQPLVAFQPLPDPRTGNESEGIAELTFAPPGFPAGLEGGLIMGFHGKFNLGGLENEENALVYTDPATGEYFHLVESRTPGVGHLDGLLASGDSLFVADISSIGSLSTGSGKGVIYRIRALPAPPGPRFICGDSNGDGAVDVSDGIATLTSIFLGSPTLPCPDAADANDDAAIDISDAVAVFLYL